MRVVFTNIRKIWGIETTTEKHKAGSDMSEVDSIENAWLCCEGGKIVGFGSTADGVPNGDEVISLAGLEILPGFIDSHTHTVFASPRAEEWEMRIKGKSYEEIAEAGGGILNSAKRIAQASAEELLDEASKRVGSMIAHGTLALEIKSGYGLTHENEIKMLHVAQALKRMFPIPIFVTYLGAHAVPLEYKQNPDAYVDEIIEKTLPFIASQGLADFIDVFCDKGFFTPEQTERIILAAKEYHLPAKIHANELGLTGGIQVATKTGAYSADHCEYTELSEIEAFKNSDTVPVALPGTSYFLGIPYTPLRKIIDAGLAPAIASDFNPGSSPVFNMQMIWSLACTQQKLLPQEGFWACTLNAARALRIEKSVGSIAIGKSANFITTHLDDALRTIPYFFGTNHIHSCYINAQEIYTSN